MRIIIISEPGSGSTLLYNMILGAFHPNQQFNFLKIRDGEFLINQKYVDAVPINCVYKTHVNSLQRLRKMLSESERGGLFFITPRRFFSCGHRHHDAFTDRDEGVLAVDYTDFVSDSQDSPERACRTVYKMLKEFLPNNCMYSSCDETNISNMVKRVTGMNRRYEEIKTKPFNYEDSFYGIHGSHRSKDSRPKFSWERMQRNCKKCRE